MIPDSSGTDTTWPDVPPNTRVYAIGDVHGRSDLLSLLLSRIDEDAALEPVSHTLRIFLGDYIDRGNGSRQVIDILLAQSASKEAVFLRGNHETFVEKFLNTPGSLNDWQRYGGLETLISYGLKPSFNPSKSEQTRLATNFATLIPDAHRKFFRELQNYCVFGDFLFVHAGVRPNLGLSQQKEDDLLGIREDFLLWKEPFEKFVVHGHTPNEEIDIQLNRINIDTGAYATGRLTCLIIEHGELSFLQTGVAGRRPLLLPR